MYGNPLIKKEMSTELNSAIDKTVFNIDEAAEIKRIGEHIRTVLRDELRRRGCVVAVSGGIDSSVSAALCVDALGSSKVFGLLLPEKDSSDDSVIDGKSVMEYLGIDYIQHDITSTLEEIGCYRMRNESFRRVFSQYDDSWRAKIVLSGGNKGQYNHFLLVVESPDGEVMEKRLGHKDYLQIVAATNFKQRVRKNIEYFHADRLNYAVVGTPNRLEYDQGFFVKNGEGSADIKPIAHLYKTQVYALARTLGLPEKICNARPTTDTYSMEQGQDEFYFGLPYGDMDLALWANNQNVPVEELAKALQISVDKARLIYNDIVNKRRATRYLHAKPYLIEEISELNDKAES